jgi:hypothetical protein
MNDKVREIFKIITIYGYGKNLNFVKIYILVLHRCQK